MSDVPIAYDVIEVGLKRPTSNGHIVHYAYKLGDYYSLINEDGIVVAVIDKDSLGVFNEEELNNGKRVTLPNVHYKLRIDRTLFKEICRIRHHTVNDLKVYTNDFGFCEDTNKIHGIDATARYFRFMFKYNGEDMIVRYLSYDDTMFRVRITDENGLLCGIVDSFIDTFVWFEWSVNVIDEAIENLEI